MKKDISSLGSLLTEKNDKEEQKFKRKKILNLARYLCTSK